MRRCRTWTWTSSWGELLTRIRDVLDADTAAVLLRDDLRDELVARAAVGLEEEVEQGVRIPIGGGFAGRIAAERRPIVLDDVDHADVLNPILREKGIKSMAGVPLVFSNDVLGVLHIGSLTPRIFTKDDVELLDSSPTAWVSRSSTDGCSRPSAVAERGSSRCRECWRRRSSVSVSTS